MSILTKNQQLILDKIAADETLCRHFYFSGGTALSEYYLQHRYSDDLDFFSPEKFESQAIFTKFSSWSGEYGFSFKPEFIDPAYMIFCQFPEGELKIDFVYYPFLRLEKERKKDSELAVDSLLDIAVNKLFTLTQRTEIKDLVDLYYLLKEYSVWDLASGVKKKFKVEIDPLLIASDFLAVEDFDYLPKMIKPLKLLDLKTFYCDLAKKLSGSSVEK